MPFISYFFLNFLIGDTGPAAYYGAVLKCDNCLLLSGQGLFFQVLFYFVLTGLS